MIIIITGATHSGKTFCAQKLMEKMNIPYISQDHIKMGLIRSGYSTLTPDSPDKVMTDFIWPVTREMIKTAVENKQNSNAHIYLFALIASLLAFVGASFGAIRSRK